MKAKSKDSDVDPHIVTVYMNKAFESVNEISDTKDSLCHLNRNALSLIQMHMEKETKKQSIRNNSPCGKTCSCRNEQN